MGACFSDDGSANIDRHITDNQRADKKIRKLLLLGSGSSGKSTIFKQLRDIYDDSKEFEEHDTLTNIRCNAIMSLIKLLQKSEEFARLGVRECFIDISQGHGHGHIAGTIKTLVQHKNTVWSEMHPDYEAISAAQLSTLGECIHELWTLEQLSVHTYRRRNLFSFGDSAPYFLNKSRAIFQSDYVPTFEDFLKVRIRTVGMNCIEYTTPERHIFRIIDVGGQSNERRKWYQYFAGVRAVLFVASLAAYYRVTFDDESQNAMHESIEVFSSVINNKIFAETDFVLLLNKNDLLRELLAARISLSHCFAADKHWNGPFWRGPDYTPNQNQESPKTAIPMSASEHREAQTTTPKRTPTPSSPDVEAREHSVDFYSTADEKAPPAAGDFSPSLNPMSAPVLHEQHSSALLLGDDSNNNNRNSNSNAQERAQARAQTMNESIVMDVEFENCYRAAIRFIKKVYISQKKQTSTKGAIYTHVTTATDRTVIQMVFSNVEQVIIKQNLINTGIIL